MVGSGIVALPWTFSESGFLLGLIICVLSLAISYRTCILMIRTAGNDGEYFETLYKHLGRWAYYCGYIATIFIMIAAVTSYFINLSQMLHTICLALLSWIFGLNLDPTQAVHFDRFSFSYITLFVLGMEIAITSKKDLSIFIRLMSFGSVFIIMLITFIIGFGLYGFGTTNYQIVGPTEQVPVPLPDDE